MADPVDIEIQDKYGNWKRYSTVPNIEARIKQALKSALAYRRADHPEQARAVERGSEQVLDVLRR